MHADSSVWHSGPPQRGLARQELCTRGASQGYGGRDKRSSEPAACRSARECTMIGSAGAARPAHRRPPRLPGGPMLSDWWIVDADAHVNPPARVWDYLDDEYR